MISDDTIIYAKQWLLKAEHDILGVKRLIEIEPLLLDTAAFHCQQAVEKSMKSYLALNNAHIEKTHDLKLVQNETLKIDNTFQNFHFGDLDDFAVNGRYPGDVDDLEKGEVEEYLKLAETIYATAKAKLP
jgi:HEPN domain-containing protein